MRKIKKKLRDLTREEAENVEIKLCGNYDEPCFDCYLNGHHLTSKNESRCCYMAGSVFYDNKEAFNDTFLDREVIISVPEILDSTERRYLKDIIWPFKHRVVSITKTYFDKNLSQLIINLKFFDKNDEDYGDYIDVIMLPLFNTYSMYVGMDLDKPYTLEELGLK